MKRYKLIAEYGYSIYKKGEIYDEDYRDLNSSYSVKELAAKMPNDWELVEDFIIPEKWCVEVYNNEQFHIVRKYLSKLPGCSFGGINHCIHNPFSSSTNKKYFIGMGIERNFFYNYSHSEDRHAPLITFDQFEKYILNAKREITGYIAPFDLFGGSIKKGTIYKKLSPNYEWYSPLTCSNTIFKDGQSIPKEIVEQWEPVYQEITPQITINGYKGEFFDNYVKFGCAEIHKQLFLELYAVKDSTWVNGGREIESITIGKGTFTKKQIKEIAEYYLNK